MIHPVLLIILDGFGEGADYPGNAVKRAKLTTLPELRKKYPVSLLNACGHAVGVPEGTQGGSEVGHFTMGAGRRVFLNLEAINRAIAAGSLDTKQEVHDAFAHIAKTGGKLHLVGMISDQGVHSHIEHLFALMELAKRHAVNKIFIHCITDGRDVRERSSKAFLQSVITKIDQLELRDKASIATIMGRYYAMDRDSNYDRTQKAYDLLTEGIGTEESDPGAAIDNAYSRGAATDYYIDPIILNKDGLIEDPDSVIFFNFRSDRMRQLTWAFTGESDPKTGKPIGFTPQKVVRPHIVCFGPFSHVAPVVFPTPIIPHNLASVISENNIKQFRLGETEKYAHVTYFFNSQIETPYKDEERLMIDSPKCPSYAEKPEMSARGITEALLKNMSAGYGLIVTNFANCDLVGHSGNLAAAITAVEVVDECLGRIVPAALTAGYTVLITADHGNVEEMLYPDGSPCPSHTRNPVPFIFCQSGTPVKLVEKGELADVAPTVLEVMGIPQPEEMTGHSLIKKSL